MTNGSRYRIYGGLSIILYICAGILMWFYAVRYGRNIAEHVTPLLITGGMSIAMIIGGIYLNYKKMKYYTIHYIHMRWKEKDSSDDINLEDFEKAYKLTQKEHEGVNKQTLTDLKILQLFKRIDNSVSFLGKFGLMRMLTNPMMKEKELQSRNRKIKWFEKDKEKRESVHVQFMKVSRDKNYGFTYMVYKGIFRHFSKSEKIIIFMLSKVWIVFVGMLFMGNLMGLVGLVILAAINSAYLKIIKLQPERDSADVSKAGNIIVASERIADILTGVEEFESTVEELKELTKKCRGIKVNSGITVKSDIPLSPGMEMMRSYFDMIMLYCARKYVKVSEHMDQNKVHLQRIMDVLGELEALISVAHYRKFNDYCIPIIQGKKIIKGTDMINTLVNNCVENSMYIDKGIIITGCNMSGKSTFLRTLGICQLLAQTIMTVPAKSYETDIFSIVTSIDIHDDIENNKSYYFVEIENIKNILDCEENEHPVLAIIDEILNGTNPMDRVAASKSILDFMDKKNFLPIIATHDMELRDHLQDKFNSYYFTEDVEKEHLLFDYKVREGRSLNRNAIKLLRILKYPEEILKGLKNI